MVSFDNIIRLFGPRDTYINETCLFMQLTLNAWSLKIKNNWLSKFWALAFILLLILFLLLKKEFAPLFGHCSCKLSCCYCREVVVSWEKNATNRRRDKFFLRKIVQTLDSTKSIYSPGKSRVHFLNFQGTTSHSYNSWKKLNLKKSSLLQPGCKVK